MANTSKVIDLDRLARFKASRTRPTTPSSHSRAKAASIATADKAGIVKPGGDFRHHRGRHHQPVQGDGRQLAHRFPSQAERGSTVADVTVAWSLSKTPKSLTLDDKAQDTASKGTTLSGVNLKASKTYTLKATDARNAVATRTADVAFPRQAPLVGRRQPRRGGSDRPDHQPGDRRTRRMVQQKRSP